MKELRNMPCALTILYIMCIMQSTTHLGPHYLNCGTPVPTVRARDPPAEDCGKGVRSSERGAQTRTEGLGRGPTEACHRGSHSHIVIVIVIVIVIAIVIVMHPVIRLSYTYGEREGAGEGEGEGEGKGEVKGEDESEKARL